MSQIWFAGAGLDRSGHFRRDDEWLRARLEDAATRFVPLWRGRTLVHEPGDALAALTLDRAALPAELVDLAAVSLLSIEGGVAYFAVEIAGDAEPLALLETLTDAEKPRFQELLAAGPRLGHRDGALLAYAKGLIYWHSRHRFCGVCGSVTVPVEAGHVRRCTNPDCKTSHFPRTDPAVIMLVTDGERVLLGRQPVWPKGMHSVLAGFLEPGESLEEAVAREVREEVGLEIERTLYQGSQPWPFPGSIMLGFRAWARTTDIVVDPSELETARWVTRDWLKANPNDPDCFLPPRGAIARQMVDEWVAEG
jgi:NAD+ diphosphatase